MRAEKNKTIKPIKAWAVLDANDKLRAHSIHATKLKAEDNKYLEAEVCPTCGEETGKDIEGEVVRVEIKLIRRKR